MDADVYDSQPLFEEHFIVLLADSHPLASRTSIGLAQLANSPLLLYDRGVGPVVYDKTLALFKAAGIQPHVVGAQPPPYAQAAMMLVASGQGFYLGIASPFTQTHRVSGVAVVPLDEPDARVEVRISWRRNEALRAATEFVRSARAVFPWKSERPKSGAA
jgi:DNA-binding transcriptional LysR family regulator